jgi:hypothetical protein
LDLNYLGEDLRGKERSKEKQKTNTCPVADATSLASLTVSVFDFWKQECDHPKAKLDRKRKAAIAARLKEGFTVEELSTAVRGCRSSPYHQGQNDAGATYDDIELICRDAKHVESFIAKTEVGPNEFSRNADDAPSIFPSTPEEVAKITGRDVEEVRAKWN